MFFQRTVTAAAFLALACLAAAVVGVAADSPRHDEDHQRLWECRRDPTWRRSIDPKECQRVTQYKPRDRWWKHDLGNTAHWLGANETTLTECLDEALQDATLERCVNLFINRG